MLLQVAAEIEAELAQGDDPDDPGPQGPGQRLTRRCRGGAHSLQQPGRRCSAVTDAVLLPVPRIPL